MPYKDIEKRREHQRIYAKQHKDKITKYQKRYRIKHRQAFNEYMKRWRNKHKELYTSYLLKNKEAKRRKRLAIRLEIISLLGEKCVKCGYEKNIRALQIDHVNNDGYIERRKLKNSDRLYKHILKQVKNGSKNYQVLCANCNIIKKYKCLDTIIEFPLFNIKKE